jgi:hypothetical protein
VLKDDRGLVLAHVDHSPVEAMVDPATEAGFERMLRDRESKQLVSLATRLRLTDQARYTAAAAGSAASRPRPWGDSP